MAKSEDAFPTMPILHWWTLRKRFKERINDIIPGIVTEKYIATILNARQRTIQNDVMPCLSTIGFLTETGRTRERLGKWLDDNEYSNVCNEILEDVYPLELRLKIDDPIENKTEAEEWFKEYTGCERMEIRKMVAFYGLLCDQDLSKSPSKLKKKTMQKSAAILPFIKEDPQQKAGVSVEVESRQIDYVLKKLEEMGALPNLSINFQVNISSETTGEQIDTIFSSIARHLKKEDPH